MRLFRSPSSAVAVAGAVLALTVGARLAVAAAPDLTFATPAGFSSQVVFSNGPGNTQGSTTLYTTDTVYLNFGYTNIGGDIPASSMFSITLQIDGNTVANAIPAQAGIAANVVVAVKDIKLGSLPAGDHSVTIILNPAPTTIVESNTANNTITTNTPKVLLPAPVITSSLSVIGTAGQPFNYQIQATNNPTSFSAANLPPGLSVTPTGLISGSPATNGTDSIIITAGNSFGTDTKTLTLTVGAIPPAVTSPLSAQSSVGLFFTYNVTGTGLPAPTFSTSTLPPGITFGGTQISGIPTQPGTIQITITATNPAGVDSKTLVLNVTSPPVINSPLIIGGAVGDNTFDYFVTGTNNPNFFATSQLPPGFNAINSQTGEIRTAASGPTAAGTYTVTLTAKNTINASSSSCVFANSTGVATATATFAISNVKGAPAITSPLSASGIETTPFAYGITATNADATTVYSATFPPGLTGLVVDSKTGLITGLPGLLPGAFPVAAQTYAVTITATNSKGAGSATLNLTVNPATPTITSDVVDQVTVITQQLFQYQITATSFTNPSVGATTFSGNFPIPSSNISVDPVSGLMSGTPVDGPPPSGDVGNYTVTITASNSRGSDTKTFQAVVASAISTSSTTGVPQAIVFTGPYNAVAVAGCPFHFAATATNAQCYRMAQGTSLPPHLVLDGTGNISGTPQAADVKVNPPYTFTIGASILVTTDPTVGPTCLTPNQAEATFTLSILPAPPQPSPPVITSPINNSLTVGTPFTYTITTTPDITNPVTPLPLFYSSSALPNGLAIQPSEVDAIGNPPGQIVGIPTVPGSTVVSISALNSAGSDTKTITITVAHLVITNTLSATGQVGQPFSFQITASGSANVFTAVGLPPGLSVTQAGQITGIPVNVPNQSGPIVYPVTLTASNPYDTATATLNLTINPAPAGSPVITSPLTASGTDGIPFNYQITATNGANGFDALGLPTGLKVDKTSGTIFGTPTSVGSFNVTLLATTTAISNGAGASIMVLTINPAPPVITSPLTATAIVGQPFNYTFTATGTPAINYTANTALPTGLTLSGSVLSGSFTAGGTYTVTIQASNAAPATDTEVLTITVTQAPTITSTLTASGQVGVPFSYTITAAGTTPIVYSAAPLLPGLTFSGATISGTPTQAAPTFNITLIATNSVGKDTQTLVLTVAPAPPPPPPSISSPLTVSATQGVPFTYQINAGPGTATAFSATALPPGLSIDNVKGLISGTPTVAGSFSVPLSITIPQGPINATLTINVASGAPLITSLTGIAVQGLPLSLPLTATGAPPITFTASGLPSGLVLSNGTISGISTVYGDFSVQITATNAYGVDNETLVLSIAQEPDDLDSDGFPNELELALGTDPMNAASTPFGGAKPQLSRALNVTNTLIKLNFASPGNDSISLKGTFNAPVKFFTSGQSVIMVVGGIVKNFTLDANGAASTGNDAFKAALRGKPDLAGDVNATFSAKFDKGSFTVTLNKAGLTGNSTLTAVSRTVRIFLLFPKSQFLYDSSKVLSYTVKSGRSGVAKQVSPYSVK